MKRPTLTLPRFYFDGCGKEAVFPILLLKAITGKVFCCNPVNLMTVQSEADQRGMFHMSRYGTGELSALNEGWKCVTVYRGTAGI